MFTQQKAQTKPAPVAETLGTQEQASVDSTSHTTLPAATNCENITIGTNEYEGTYQMVLTVSWEMFMITYKSLWKMINSDISLRYHILLDFMV